MPTSTGFYGRETEIAWLRGMFESCAARNVDGKFIGGPRMAFVVAESGIGKSRLVQELYLQLTSDAIWDPPTIDYWPDAFLEVGAQLRTVPDMKGHVPKGPPRFAWLGARWQTTEVRNVQERRSILPSLRSSVMVHAEILKSHGSAWDDATARIVNSVKRDGVGETVSAIADLSSVPFVGLLMKLAKGTSELLKALPTPRDAVAYIMETFPIVKKNYMAVHGVYRTKERILALYDQLQSCLATNTPFVSALTLRRPARRRMQMALSPNSPHGRRARRSPRVGRRMFIRRSPAELRLEIPLAIGIHLKEQLHAELHLPREFPRVR